MRLFERFLSKNENPPLCPNCCQPFETIPKGSGKCLNCKQKYYLIRDNETKKEIITNKEGRQEILSKNRNLKRYIEWFNPFLYTTDKESSEKMINGMIKIKNDWFKKNPDRSFNDFLWSSLNDEVQTSIEDKDYEQVSKYYQYMSEILHEEGKDNYKLLCECHKMKLLGQREKLKKGRKELGLDLDMMVSVNGSYLNRDNLCENCRNVVDKEMTLDEMIKLNPLPVKDCTCQTGYCDCYYFDVWKVD